jgi:hypothetical protein
VRGRARKIWCSGCHVRNRPTPATSTACGKVEALEAGADDYVTKPFSTAELLARISAALRRAPISPQGAARLHLGRLEIDFAAPPSPTEPRRNPGSRIDSMVCRKARNLPRQPQAQTNGSFISTTSPPFGAFLARMVPR